MSSSNQIRVRCFTNLDLYALTKWPDYFCCRPQLGDKVRDARISVKAHAILKIVAITHHIDEKGPFLEIELHN